MATLGLLQKPAAPPRRLHVLLEAQQAQWPLFVPVAMGAGIALWFQLPANGLRQAALLLLMGLGIAGLLLRGPIRPVLAGGALLAALGLVAADWRSLSVAAPRLHHRVGPVAIEGLLLSVVARAGGASARLVVARDGPGGAPGDRFAILLADPPPSGLAPGARVRVVAMLSPPAGPTVPGGYHPARRAWFEGIAASGMATGPPLLLAPAPARPFALDRVRQAIDTGLAAALGAERGALAAALVTGSQGGIPPPLVDAMRAAGLAHLLTVSGFHVGTIAGFAFFLARRGLLLWPALALRLPVRALAAVIAAAAAWAYVLVSGAEVPAVRAGLTASIVLLALALGRDPLSLRLVAFAAAVILLARPEVLLSPSFQLSFAAVTAILLLLNSAPVTTYLRRDAGDGFTIRLLKGSAILLLTSLVAEITLSPIAAAHFGRAGAYGVLANLAAIPLVSFLLLPLLVVHLVASWAGLPGLVAPLLALALDLFAAIAWRVSALPGSTLAIPTVPPLAFGLGVAGALLFALLSGRARLIGLPLLSAALAVHLLSPRPDLFISADARQVGIAAADGRLFIARGTGQSQVVRAWASAAAAPAILPLARHPSARCSGGGCAVRLASGLDVLVLTAELPVEVPALERACSPADLVIGPVPPAICRPRWRVIDRTTLARTGAVAIDTARRYILPAAGPPSDHPWHPAALPGAVPTLLSGSRWMEPIAE